MTINTVSSSRLHISPLSKEDSSFIYELVNSDGWLRFIGDRNVNSLKDAAIYIANILTNEAVNYWVVRLQATGEKLGVVTLIQKDYLDHPDIGFAFLPAFEGKGYAYESASVLLEEFKASGNYQTILACTIPGNSKSIGLLERLGLDFSKQINVEGEELLLYSLVIE